MALTVSTQVCRDRRANGMLQLSRAKEVSKVSRPMIGDDHAGDTTFVTKIWGGHVGEWCCSGWVK
jgi:hypothetical protein